MQSFGTFKKCGSQEEWQLTFFQKNKYPVPTISLRSYTKKTASNIILRRPLLYKIFTVYLFCLFVLKKLPVLRLFPSGLPMRSIAQRKPIVLLAWSSSWKRRVPGPNQ